MDFITIKGRTNERERADLRLTLSVAEDVVTIRLDDNNLPLFWAEIAIPQAMLLRAVSEQHAYISHHNNPDTGLPDERCTFEVIPPDAEGPDDDIDEEDDDEESGTWPPRSARNPDPDIGETILG